MNRVILFAAQIKRLFPPRWTSVLLIRARPVLRALVKLNRCVRSLKLYVVADTHAHLPRDIREERERERERVFWIKTFVSIAQSRDFLYSSPLSLSLSPLTLQLLLPSQQPFKNACVRVWMRARPLLIFQDSPPLLLSFFYFFFYLLPVHTVSFLAPGRTRDDGGGA